MTVRISLQPVTATGTAGPLLLIKYNSTHLTRSASETLLKLVDYGNLKDYQWYFEQYVIKDPFAHARARTVARKIRDQGKLLLESFIKPVINEIGTAHDEFLIEILEGFSDIAADRPADIFPVSSFFWEILEDVSLWPGVFGREPRHVTIARSYKDFSVVSRSSRKNTLSAKISSDENTLSYSNHETKPSLLAPHPSEIDVSEGSDSSNPKITPGPIHSRGKATNILAITARPSHTKDIPHRLITRSIAAAMDMIRDRSDSQPTLEIVRPGTFTALEKFLERHPPGHFSVAHLDLHGDADGKGAYLIFTKRGPNMKLQPDQRQATEVASLLVRFGIQIVVINACRSAARSNEASNIASHLVKTGIKVAIGMCFNVLSLSADRFMRDFYAQLLGQHTSPITAVSHARRGLRRDPFRMSKYHTKIVLEDHLVPIVHCQESEVEDFVAPAHEGLDAGLGSSDDQISLDFIGRESDLLRLEWILAQGGARIHLQGSPGVGKSRLMQEASAWWQTTGFFKNIVHLSLADADYRNCTTDKILRSITSQCGVNYDVYSIKTAIAAIDLPSVLIAIDSLDAVDWSSDLPVEEHQRQTQLCLMRFKKCSIVVLSRTEDIWLGTAMQSWITLESIDLSNTIALGTGILRRLGHHSKLVTQDDQSFFEQLITMSQGNPLAVRIIIYDLAKHFADEPSTTVASHLLSLLRLRPVFLDLERLVLDGGTRFICEVLEWVAEDVRTDSSLESVENPRNGFLPQQDYPLHTSNESFKSLERSVSLLQQGHTGYNPMIRGLDMDRKLAKCGFYSIMVLIGFWHNMPYDLEQFIFAFTTMLVARRYLQAENLIKLRKDLCDLSEENAWSARYFFDSLKSKQPFGMSPDLAYYCMYAGTKAFSKFSDARTQDLRQIIHGPVEQDFGKQGNQFRKIYTSVSPVITLISQSKLVRALFPETLTEDIEIARDAQFRHRLGEWVDCSAQAPESPFHSAMTLELSFDFFNFLSLALSHQQMNSWPNGTHWQLQQITFLAAMSDPRRLRLAERVLSLFIQAGLQQVLETRRRFANLETGGYDPESQDSHYNSWSIATDLEMAIVIAMTRAMTCCDLLQISVDLHYAQWSQITSRPMFQVWKHTESIRREFLSQNITLNTRWFEMVRARKPLEVATTDQLLEDMSQFRNRRAKLFGLDEVDTALEASKEISQRILENTFGSLGGQNSILIRAHAAVHRVRIEAGKANSNDLKNAIGDLQALLAEEIENENSVLIRMLIHGHLSSLHNALGEKAIAVQHRTIKEDLKSTLEPEQVQQMLDVSKINLNYERERRRAKGEPINQAQSLALQLETRRAELTMAEGADVPDEVHVLSCVDRLGDTLRDLGRDAEAAEHFLRVIKGRQRLLPPNDTSILIVRFARSKLLSNLHQYNEAIGELRQLREQYAQLDDPKILNNVTGTLGQTLVGSVSWQGRALAEDTRHSRIAEARELLEHSASVVEDIFEPGDANISIAFSGLASLCESQSEFLKAESYYQSAIRVHLTRTSDQADSNLIITQNNLASLWQKMGKHQEAEDLLDRILNSCIERYEIWHPMSCVALSNLWNQFEKSGSTDKARKLIQDSMSRFHTSLAEAIKEVKLGDLEILDAKYRFGRTLSLCDFHEEAIALLEEVAVGWRRHSKQDADFVDLLKRLRYSYSSRNPPQLDNQVKTSRELVELMSERQGPEDPNMLNEMGQLVVGLRQQKNLTEAITTQKRLVKARKSTLGMTNEITLGNVSYLAEIYAEMLDWSNALQVRMELYLAFKNVDPDKRDTITQLSYIAALHTKLEDWDQVIHLRRDEASDWRRLEGADSNNTVNALYELACAHENKGEYSEARRIMDEVIEIRSRVLEADHTDALEAQRVKARICRKAGDLDESERILHEVLSTRIKYPAQDNTRCLALTSLSGVHLARGQVQQANEFFLEAWKECDGLGLNFSQRPLALAHLAMAVANQSTVSYQYQIVKEALNRALCIFRAQQTSPQILGLIEECERLLSNT